MNNKQTEKFKRLWTQLEEVDALCRADQAKNKGNIYHAMVADLKGLNITVGEAYKVVAADPKKDFYEVFLDLLEKKVKIAQIMTSRWFE